MSNRKPMGFWTKKECCKAAQNCQTKSQFNKKYNTAYKLSLKNNWLNDFCIHMKQSKMSNGYWTKNKCKEVSIKYKTRTEFKKKCQFAYKVACNNKWIDECCYHMCEIKKPNRYWSKRKCLIEAKKFINKNEWKKNSQTSYNTALKNKWLNICCKHMKNKGLITIKWTIKKLMMSAKRYTARSEWEKNDRKAYDIATRRGILNECCKHMLYLGNLKKRLVYVYEFLDNYVYIGLTCHENRRKYDHFTNTKRRISSPVFKHYLKTNNYPNYKRITVDYVDSNEAQNIERLTIESYKNNNWNLLNKAKAGGLGGNLKWTKEKCIADAKKHIHKSDWQKKSNSAYGSAWRNGWKDICTQHMIPKLRYKYTN